MSETKEDLQKEIDEAMKQLRISTARKWWNRAKDTPSLSNRYSYIAEAIIGAIQHWDWEAKADRNETIRKMLKWTLKNGQK